MFAAFDDRGRLYVTESSGLDLYAELQAQTRQCRVSRLEDRDGDGQYEHAVVFADQLVFPMGLVWRDGRLYVADPPDLVVFEDIDDDGRGDSRQVLLTGFGHTDNGSLHGLTFGPDGWLYMTMGHPDGYRLQRSDGSILAGTNGALIRVRPDGTGPEVVCRGFTNLVEVAFLPDGSAIGTDNYFQSPNAGWRDALVHLVAGGLYPQNTYRDETEHIVTGDPLPPVSLLTTTGISGIVRYRGSGFPPPLRGSLFSAQHNTRKVQQHVLARRESTWTSDDIDFVTTADPYFHPSDLLEDAAGNLLIVDTGAWYVQHCPTGRIQSSPSTGGIYRVRHESASAPSDPWGGQINWDVQNSATLLSLLSDARPMVADRAERQIEQQSGLDAGQIAAWIRGRSIDEAAFRAAWILVRRGDDASRAELRNLLQSEFTGLVSIAAQGAGQHADRLAEPLLATLVAHEDPAVRLHASLALARCGSGATVPVLRQALAQPSDPFLEHALIYALAHAADANQLTSALADSSPRVQRAALILLDQSPHRCLEEESVATRLNADDRQLRRAAIAALMRHLEWSETARNLVQQLVRAAELDDERQQTLRSVILAFAVRSNVASEVARAIVRPTVPLERRALLLSIISESLASEISVEWKTVIGDLLDHGPSELQLAAARAAARLDLAELVPAIAKLSSHELLDQTLRFDLLRFVIRHGGGPDSGSIEWLLNRVSDDLDPLGQLAAAEVLAQASLRSREIGEFLDIVRDRPLISVAVLWPVLERAAEAHPALVLKFLEGRQSAGWQPGPDELQRILSRLPAEHRAAGDELLRRVQAAREIQSQELVALTALSVNGDPERGRAVFFGTRAACSACHRVGSEGGRIGPDLTRIGASRSPPDLVESIVFPSSTIAQGFEAFQVQTTDGHVFSGIIKEQSPEVVVLVDSARQETRLRRESIEAMNRSSVSMMPEGFRTSLSPREFGDLLAWLQSLR